jgi:hypothetical protein
MKGSEAKERLLEVAVRIQSRIEELESAGPAISHFAAGELQALKTILREICKPPSRPPSKPDFRSAEEAFEAGQRVIRNGSAADAHEAGKLWYEAATKEDQ